MTSEDINPAPNLKVPHRDSGETILWITNDSHIFTFSHSVTFTGTLENLLELKERGIIFALWY